MIRLVFRATPRHPTVKAYTYFLFTGSQWPRWTKRRGEYLADTSTVNPRSPQAPITSGWVVACEVLPTSEIWWPLTPEVQAFPRRAHSDPPFLLFFCSLAAEGNWAPKVSRAPMAPVESRAYLVPQVHWASKACRVSQASQESPEFRFVAFPFSCVVDVGLVLGLDHVFL